MGKKYKMNFRTFVFNVSETLLLILMAYILKIGIRNLLIVFLSFQLSRAVFKTPKHFKSWKRCLVWTLSLFTSLFLVIKIDVAVGVLASVFTAYIISGKADLNDMYMWKQDNISKYQKLIDYIKFNGLNKNLIDSENSLKELDSMMYLVYKRKFRENKTFKEIGDELDISNPRIVEMLDKIYFYFIGALKI